MGQYQTLRLSAREYKTPVKMERGSDEPRSNVVWFY